MKRILLLATLAAALPALPGLVQAQHHGGGGNHHVSGSASGSSRPHRGGFNRGSGDININLDGGGYGGAFYGAPYPIWGGTYYRDWEAPWGNFAGNTLYMPWSTPRNTWTPPRAMAPPPFAPSQPLAAQSYPIPYPPFVGYEGGGYGLPYGSGYAGGPGMLAGGYRGILPPGRGSGGPVALTPADAMLVAMALQALQRSGEAFPGGKAGGVEAPWSDGLPVPGAARPAAAPAAPVQPAREAPAPVAEPPGVPSAGMPQVRQAVPVAAYERDAETGIGLPGVMGQPIPRAYPGVRESGQGWGAPLLIRQAQPLQQAAPWQQEAFSAPALGQELPSSVPSQAQAGGVPDLIRLDFVVGVQRELRRRGFYQGVVHGISDTRTRAAIRSYESSLGLPGTGVISLPLLHSLGFF